MLIKWFDSFPCQNQMEQQHSVIYFTSKHKDIVLHLAIVHLKTYKPVTLSMYLAFYATAVPVSVYENVLAFLHIGGENY